MRILKRGMIGDDVKTLQQFLGVAVDGAFGAQTEAAVEKWQRKNGLLADGIVGPITWTAMFEQKAVDGCVIYNPLKVHITKYANRPIKYIAIHYTAGRKSTKGAAESVKNTFEKRKASADFCVDDYDIVQFNPDLNNYYCWSVGDLKHYSANDIGGSLYGKATNKNTISVEICSNLRVDTSVSVPNHSGWYFTDAAIQNAAKIVKILMNKYSIPIDNVIRHYDVSGKFCPGVIGWNNGRLYTTLGKSTNEYNNNNEWIKFKSLL